MTQHLNACNKYLKRYNVYYKDLNDKHLFLNV